MKLLKRDINSEGFGYVKVIPEQPEDLWHAYNLIGEGDRVECITLRKVQRDTAGGGTNSERVRIKLEVVVETIEFDSLSSAIRLKGKNIAENEHVKLGAYHTLELELQRAFTLTKDDWDTLCLDRLKEATDPSVSADVAAVLMQEGMANLCLVGGSITTVRAKIETAIPRKRGPAIAGYDKAVKKFFENVMQSVLRHVDFSIVRCLIIASPGFTKDQFAEYLFLEATRQDIRPIIENKSRIVLAHCSSGYKHALKEVLAAPEVVLRIQDTKAAKEVKAMQDFYQMLTADPSKAFYGPDDVAAATERLAVQTLLVSDSLFRSADVPTRRRYVELVESVRVAGGTVHIFSSLHVSGEQLNQLSGIAAILRFPLPDLEDMD